MLASKFENLGPLLAKFEAIAYRGLKFRRLIPLDNQGCLSLQSQLNCVIFPLAYYRQLDVPIVLRNYWRFSRKIYAASYAAFTWSNYRADRRADGRVKRLHGPIVGPIVGPTGSGRRSCESNMFDFLTGWSNDRAV